MEPLDALFKGVHDGDVTSVIRLVRDNTDLARARDADTLSILQFARFMRRDDVLEALIAVGPPLDLYEAASLNRTHRTAELLDATPDLLNSLSTDGFTSLHLASYYGAPDVVQLLLQRGADVNAVTKNFLENMPIHAAAAGRRLAICEMLLDHAADVNAKQHGGFTALHAPAQNGDREMVELFLSRGADPSMPTDEGKTPADIAAEQGNIELAAMLRAVAAPWLERHLGQTLPPRAEDA
jgi:uncharacterized protein